MVSWVATRKYSASGQTRHCGRPPARNSMNDAGMTVSKWQEPGHHGPPAAPRPAPAPSPGGAIHPHVTEMSEDSGAPALIGLDQARVLRAGRTALDGVSLRLPQGRHTAILGPNGCGKSTFIQLITRQLYPLAHVDGRPAVRILGQSRWNVATLRARLGIVTGAMHDDLL